MTDSSTRWRVAPTSDLRWRVWEDQVVVFHPPSGDTHLLNPFAAEVLQYLQKQPADLDEIAAYVAGSEGSGHRDADEDVLRQLEKLVSDFDQLGLIEPSHETE